MTRAMFRRLILLLFLLHLTSTEATGVQEQKKSDDPTEKPIKELLPIELTSKDFGEKIADGNMWLIEFYAPWCSHCKEFKLVYDQIGIHFHSRPEKKVRVGKIDGDSERALTSRFGVTAYPSLYLVNGYTVYKYDTLRVKKMIIAFVEEEHRKSSPIPFFSSPMGPVGLFQGVLLSMAYGAFNTVGWLQKEMGLSAFFAVMLLFGSVFIGIFIAIVVAAVVFTPKDKQD